MADDPKKPYGDVTYADPGYQSDGKKRYPLDSEDHCRAAWSYINMPKNAAKYSSSQLASIKSKIKSALKKYGVGVSKEGVMTKPGERAVETVTLDGQVLEAKESPESGNRIYGIKVINYGTSKNGRKYPESVMREAVGLYEGAKVYDHHRTEAELRTSTINGVVGFLRNVEAQGDGLYGDLHLLPSATHAAEALDASLALQQEGLNPLVGISHDVLARFRRNTEGGKSVHEATRIESVQSADIVAQPAAGGAAVRAIAGGDDIEEGVVPELSDELSNMLKEMTDEQLTGLGLARATTPEEVENEETETEQEPELVGAGAEAFPTKKDEKKPKPSDKKSDSGSGGGGGSMPPLNSLENAKKALAWVNSHSKELGPDKVKALKEKIKAAMDKYGTSSAKEGTELDLDVETDRSTEADETYLAKNSWVAKATVKGKCDDAELPKSAAEAVLKALPDRFTEADIDAQIALGKNWMAQIERDNLKPTLPKPGEGVTQEAFDKKKKALDGFFDGDFSGYHSFIQAYADITGNRPDIGEDYSRKILHESAGYRPENRTTRSTESMDTTTWNLVLGDSITRKMVAEYSQPGLQDWKAIVSSTVPVNDFRTQRIDRIGGYDLLPGVNQGAPYQPLTSPEDEEVTYALTKRGGTEDITLEMIANDDVRSISRIPKKLGLSAALTLHRFVWNFLTGTDNIYDGTALFTAGHNNLAAADAALSQSSVSAARAAMRKQLAYGDSNNILSIVPRTLIVPTSLEEIAFQLTTSAVAVPGTPAGPSDTPNLHKGLNYIVLDHITDSSSGAWYMVADTSQCPTLEMGFYQGKDSPELFTQADNSVGSMFDADKLTYKIRHIYSGAVLDFRGFYKTGMP
jgi:phage major head subunit gpT-like protein